MSQAVSVQASVRPFAPSWPLKGSSVGFPRQTAVWQPPPSVPYGTSNSLIGSEHGVMLLEEKASGCGQPNRCNAASPRPNGKAGTRADRSVGTSGGAPQNRIWRRRRRPCSSDSLRIVASPLHDRHPRFLRAEAGFHVGPTRTELSY